MGGASPTPRPVSPPPPPLEPSGAEMRAMAGAAVDLVTRFIDGLAEAPSSDLEGGLELARSFREPAPEEGVDLASLLATVERGASKGRNTAGPGYVAFVPGGGLYAAAVAEFVAYGLNRFVNVWDAAPAFAQIEATVITWLADLFGFPAGARGILTSGGSMANFSALVTARRALLPERFQDGTLYASDQTHASVAKAAMLAGFPLENVRLVPSTPELRLDLGALRKAVEEDRAAGFRPFCVIANAGTTNTGAVDPLEDAAALCREEGLWLHADAAYGGFFQLTARGRARFRGIEEADSITLDPHKGMFLPYGTGCLLVRDGARLREAHEHHAEYLQDLAAEDEIPNFSDYSPELSREFRGLRVWLPVKLYGFRTFREALDEKLDLARFLYEELRDTPGFAMPWEPELTVVPFRYRPAGNDDDEFNRRLLERINASGRVHLSSTRIGGRFVIRACIVSHRTHRDRIEEALEIIRRSARDLEG